MEKGSEGSSTSQMPIVDRSVPIPLPQKMDLTGNLAGSWKKFKHMWNNYEVASRLWTQSNELRTATFLTCIGPDVLDIYDGLPFDNDEEKTNIAKVSDLLEKYFIGETNETYERLPVGDVSRVHH